MRDSYPARVAALRDSLARANLDALLVTSLPNIRYITGFSGSNALLVVSPTQLILFTDFRYEVQVGEEVPDAVKVHIEESSLWQGLWRELSHKVSAERVGFESGHLVHRDFARLLEHADHFQWRPTSDIVELLRERKDPAEIALIGEAVRIAEGALSDTLPQIRAGLTETAVAGILEHALRERGSEGLPFQTIVASGPRSALPHAHPGERVLERGDLVLLDFGATYRGYCSDITRTFTLGPPTDEQLRIHGIVREANERASGSLRSGISGMAADSVAREYIAHHGLGDAFGHSLGHGIGLEIHEAPRLARTSESLIPENAVVTVEPGIYRPGWGGVRIEDDVVVTGEGARLLTTFSRDLLPIG